MHYLCVVACDHRADLSRVKNQYGHWVCWMSTSRRTEEHTHTHTQLVLTSNIATCFMSHSELHFSPAPPTISRSNADDATLNTEMIDSCCSGDIGTSSSARSMRLRLMLGGAVAPLWKAPRCTGRVCCGNPDPQLLVSESRNWTTDTKLLCATSFLGMASRRSVVVFG